jgi:hypothetical protein
MTLIRIGKDGIPRDLFSVKIVDLDNLKSNLPKIEKRQYKSTPRELFESTKITAERAKIIASYSI